MPDSVFGKRILVGLTYMDAEGRVTSRAELHGLITRIENECLFFDRSDGEGEFSVPFTGQLKLAEPSATYTLKTTGEKVTGVDFLDTWEIQAPAEEDSAEG